MTFPTKPTQPLPTWATDGGPTGSNKVDPGTTKRAAGWEIAGPGLEYGEAPPFKWVNNEAYNNGQWANYFDAALDYIKNGNLQPSYAVLKSVSSVPIILPDNTNLIFNTSTYLNTSYTPYNTSTGDFTAPITALYKIELSIIIKVNSGPNPAAVFIQGYLNGNPVSNLYSKEDTNNGSGQQFTQILYLNMTAGDVFTYKNVSSYPIQISDAGSVIISDQLIFSWNL